jgi:signal transduction histidine kinase/DNA-binding response OmpR family regulator
VYARREVAAKPASESLVARLERDLADARERQAATSEVLEAVGRSPRDLQPVFDAVVRHAVRLCDADAGMVYRLDGDVYRVAVLVGGSEEYRRYIETHPVEQGPGTLVGLVALERRTLQIDDATSDPRYRWAEALALGRFRTMLGVPMLTEGRVVGVIVLWRAAVAPFDAQTVSFVETFAAQGAIAIENVRLFRELEQRSEELARSVDELHALGEVSRAVSSSLDLDEVLDTIVSRAVELAGANGGSIFEFDRESQQFMLRACAGTSAELVLTLQQLPIPLAETFVGRTVLAGEARQLPDLDTEPPDAHLDALRRHGWRSLVAVPLRREDELIGALVVRRRSRGGWPAGIVEGLQTLASQSAVAIHNARVHRELELKRAQLEVASRHKSEFLASMSHELRTPLNAVIGFSDVLLDRMFGELNERQDEYVRDIRDSGVHLLELINEILDLSKVEAGRMELELEPVSLPDVLEQAVGMVRQRAADHGVSIALDSEPAVGTVIADELKLKQVLLNLLDNAVKFTPAGGAVTVTARMTGDEARVAVRDTGPGIVDGDRERIFEAFQRGDRAARKGAEGTGLGLTLCRRIVELHGGRLWLQSRLGEGSTFTFAIPATAPPARAPEEPAEPDGAPAPGPAGLVLVVEDDPRSAELLQVYLEGAGYAVAIARDGVEGAELAHALSPTAVVLDILLPRLNGWELLARLKQDPATTAIPVVVTSMLDERGAGFALGAAEYLVKPVDRDGLLDALARCAAESAARRAIVVMDDEPLDLDLVDATLTPEGWTVLRAASGEEGVELVRREQPAVVLLDLLMPGLDGFTVVERLRADPLTADVPIIVLTAMDMTPADRERLNGRISYLARKGTFQTAELVQLVERVAATRRATLGGTG